MKMMRHNLLVFSPLSASEYRYFWVTWDHGSIHVGEGNVMNEREFMSFTDPTPLTVNYIGLGACCGATAYWIIGKGENNID